MAYFILKGSVGVGIIQEQEYTILSYLREGDFFGEVAVLRERQRTANLIAEEDCEFLIIPAPTMKQLTRNFPEWNLVLPSTIDERLA
jgi:CRP-like cAMP-binding protein